jgi:hypothetical protein
LRKLEEQFGDSIAVVGVHSGKFTGERETSHIRDAAIRLNAAHPTINDRQFRVWRSYAVNAWPTVVAVDPRGYVVGMRAGEFAAADLVPFIERILAESRAAGTLDASPLHFPADAPSEAPGTLAFPGKVAVDGRRIAIADSGHHRVLLGELDEVRRHVRVMRVIGGAQPGFRNGMQPLFDNPQGLAFAGDRLFVADAGNHCVRAIALESGNTSTLAGIGRQARTQRDLDAGAMSSPWDIALDGGTMYVAMAGLHQLWRVDVASGRSQVHAGSGAEELHDGPHASAALAQPMGLCLADDVVCLTDSESSAVREVDVSRDGGVRTIVGTGLFDFGDVDGVGDAVRIQHPQGIALADDGRLLVADSYNGALKWIDRATRRSEVFIRGLHEPTGVAISGDTIFVAETNRHRLVAVDARSGDVQAVAIDLP